MPTEKPRVTITFQPEDYQVLTRLAGLQGGSISRIVRDLVSAVSPALARVADVLEKAQGAEEEVLAGLRDSVERGQAGVESLLAQTEEAYFALIGDAEVAMGEDPRPVTTGVRFPNPPSLPDSPKGSDDAV